VLILRNKEKESRENSREWVTRGEGRTIGGRERYSYRGGMRRTSFQPKKRRKNEKSNITQHGGGGGF